MPLQTVYFDIIRSCNARCPYCLTGIGGNVIHDDMGDILERRQSIPLCREFVRTGLASRIKGSIKAPPSYRKGLRQNFLFLKRCLRRPFPVRMR